MRTFLRFDCTRWCNYSCSYCRQEHHKHQHWADNATVEQWLAAFDSCFAMQHVTMAITGGEPMLDKRNMEPLLNGLCSREYIDRIRVDTNARFHAAAWKLPTEKLVFMASYHPTERSEAEFFRDLDGMLAAELHVAMVTLVMLPERLADVTHLQQELAARDIPLNCNPLYGKLDAYTPEQVQQLEGLIPAADWPFRTGARTFGRMCRYPSVAFEMDAAGRIETACHSDRSSSVFAGKLPQQFASSVPCPHPKCGCLDRYAFLVELGDAAMESATPLEAFAGRIPLC